MIIVVIIDSKDWYFKVKCWKSDLIMVFVKFLNVDSNGVEILLVSLCIDMFEILESMVLVFIFCCINLILIVLKYFLMLLVKVGVWSLGGKLLLGGWLNKCLLVWDSFCWL